MATRPKLPADVRAAQRRFVKRLDELRLEAEMSVEELAAAFPRRAGEPGERGIAPAAIRSWRTGASRVSRERVEEAAEIFRRDPGDVWDGWPESAPAPAKRGGARDTLIAERQPATRAEVDALRADVADLRARLEAMEAAEARSPSETLVEAFEEASRGHEKTPGQSRRVADGTQG